MANFMQRKGKPVFSEEDIRDYAETRLFGANVQPILVDGIYLRNGILPSQLEFQLEEFKGEEIKRVEQDNPREPIFLRHDKLHIPQYSGFGRRLRYERLCQLYSELQDIPFVSLDVDNDERKSNVEYDNFAYDFVMGLFVPSRKYEHRRIFEFEIDDITKIIIGPTSAVAKQANVIERGNSEYLDVQVVEIDGEKVLNLGYVYADQAGIIIDKMMREFEAVARKKEERLDIDVYMFGRAGGLKKNIQREDLVTPTGIIEDCDLFDGTPSLTKLNNILANNGNLSSFNFNVLSVLDETYEQLEDARLYGCDCVEMELSELSSAINRARKRYFNSMNIRMGVIFHVSDVPLEGDNLAEELKDDEGEQKALSEIIENIKN